MSIPAAIRIVEVGPRDGLQNEAVFVPVDDRVRFIEKLAATGLRAIEVGAFVPEGRIPQMSGTAEILRKLKLHRDVSLPVLVPNPRGFRDASIAGARQISVLTAASETFSKRNLNCSIAESLERISEIGALARAENMTFRGYISCALGCPYEGAVDGARVIEIARELYRLGCFELSIGDTIGVGTPFQVTRLIEQLARSIPVDAIAGHFHDTYGQALANIYACLQIGVNVFDCSVGGLGGCPYAPGATGNVATEDVVYMLRNSGVETGVDLDKLLEASAFICERLGHPPQSRVARACAARGGNKISGNGGGACDGGESQCRSLRNQD